jgi:general stress protein YciG
MADTGHKGKRGFAAMDPEKAREIQRRGGQTTQRLGRGHTFTPEEARAAGQKGGLAVSRNRVYMAEIGRRGRVSSQKRRAEAKDRLGEPELPCFLRLTAACFNESEELF